MIKLLKVIPLLLFLTACNQGTQIVRVNQHTPINIPPAFFNDAACPQIKQFPNYNKYTEREVADLLVKLVQSNNMCYNTIQKIKIYLQQTNQITTSK